MLSLASRLGLNRATSRCVSVLSAASRKAPSSLYQSTRSVSGVASPLSRLRSFFDRENRASLRSVTSLFSQIPGFEHFNLNKDSKKSSPSSGGSSPPPPDNNNNSNNNNQEPDPNQDKPPKEEKENKEEKKEEKREEQKEEKKEEKKESSSNLFSRFFGGKKEDSTGEEEMGSKITMFVVGSVGILAFLSLYNYVVSTTSLGKEISFQEFLNKYLEPDKVDRLVVINKNLVKVFLKDDPANRSRKMYNPQGFATENSPFYFRIGSVDAFERQMESAQREMGYEAPDFVPVTYSEDRNFAASLLKEAPSLLFLYFAFMLISNMSRGARGGGAGGGSSIFGVGRSPATMSKGGKEKTRFKDVAGLEEAKLEIMEFVQFLKNPQKFTNLGAKIPRGALLVGPPGTGKTLLAKATAGESNVPFFSISGSDFIEMFVGVGASRVRDLFRDARKHAPCIIFIDEIDAVGRSRSKSGGFGGGHDEREATLNQLLVEMDGFQTKDGVVVLAGTNRADILDQALLRAGRFDRQIYVDRPDIKGRKQIFEVHLRPLKLAQPAEEIAERMSSLTPGMVGADIHNVCNEAAILAARENKPSVEMVDFERALDRVIGGLEKKNRIMTPHERRLVAHHEAGHAVAGWFLEHADPLLKVTIVPRSSALGFAQYLPKELLLYNPKQFLDKMCAALAGRAAEQVFFGTISTGAQDDLKKVTQMAYAQIANFGFSERLGHVSFSDGNEFSKPYSESTAQAIDEEVRKMVDMAWERTLKLVSEKKTQVAQLAERLLEKETLGLDDVVQLIGKRPFAYEGAPGTEFLQRAHEAPGSAENSTSENNTDKPSDMGAVPA